MKAPAQTFRSPARQQQRGAALAISLILLVAMTIVGIATLSGTRLNERISSNVQQKAISFEVAESAISRVWSVPSLLNTLKQIPQTQFNDPVPIVPAGIAAELSTDFDQSNTANNGLSVDVDATVSIQYCGETTLPSGSSLSADESAIQFSGATFDVNGTGRVLGSNAFSDHIQRGYVVRPRTGRTGACATPGV